MRTKKQEGLFKIDGFDKLNTKEKLDLLCHVLVISLNALKWLGIGQVILAVSFAISCFI